MSTGSSGQRGAGALRKGTVFSKIIIDITTISFNRVVFLRKCIIFAQMKPKKQKLCLYDL